MTGVWVIEKTQRIIENYLWIKRKYRQLSLKERKKGFVSVMRMEYNENLSSLKKSQYNTTCKAFILVQIIINYKYNINIYII